ncbi:MAG TPA: helix-turn-helix domain-containing protein [Gaiellales bacterium]
MSGQRVDAARNRQRVLDAAAHEHARHGSALGMQDVARRAGVGIGTVYRHFPSRQALIEAIATPFFERGLALARSVREEAPEGERFAVYVREFARALATSGVDGQCRWDAPAAEPVRSELRELIGEFVSSGRESGALRGDVTAEDAFALLWTVAALVEAADAAAPEIWRRHIELVLDSLRDGPPRALEAAPVERAQWDDFVRAARVAATDDPASAA